MKNKIIGLLLVFVFLLTSGLDCKLISNPEEEAAMEPITLKYWRVWDGPDAFEEIISTYQAIHPNVTIEYKKLRYEEYERELLEAWAEDRGPDIFSIHNTWIEGYKSKILPLPPTTRMAYQVQKGTIKKELVTEVRTQKSITLNEIENNYIDVVYNDVVVENYNQSSNSYDKKIYGLPLSVDTLVMYYNKDLFNNAGIPEPPKYWDREFQQSVKKLTKQDSKGNIIQSGVALGGSTNIERYFDILSILMMQSGAQMMEGKSVTFHRVPETRTDGYNPGMDALRFYTDFSNPAKEVYSWNTNMENSLDLFIQGKLAMFFGYAYHMPTINARAPKLNYKITKLPQIGDFGEINYANYWVEAVSKKTKNIDAAWDFIQFATRSDQVKSYLNKTNKPTALRALINEQIEDSETGIFAEQLLTSKSWYRGNNSNAAELIFANMIDGVVSGQEEFEEAINLAAGRVQQTIN